jgi:hypothetical protein
MRIIRYIGVVFAAIVLANVARGNPQSPPAQKPTKQHAIHLDGGIQPTTIGELWAASPLVVDVIVTGRRAENEDVSTIGGERPAPLTKTVFQCQIQSVFKSDGQVTPNSTTLEVRRLGGVIDRGNHLDEYYDEHFPAFKVNRRYVLFLRGGSLDSPYWPMTNGGESAFEIDGERIVPYGAGELALSLGKLTTTQFLALLNQQKVGR